MILNVTYPPLAGLAVIEPRVFADERGFFMETFQQKEVNDCLGQEVSFVQDNLSSSVKGVLRGLHYQAEPYAQGKFVTVLKGKVIDVAVDIRRNSPTFGQHFSVELSEENHLFFYLPAGFAHGFLVLSQECLFMYKCTNYYHKASERGILWNDPTLNINWQAESPLVSAKDLELPRWEDVKDFF